MRCPCYCQCLNIWRAFNLAWHVIPRRELCLNLQRWSCLFGFQLCLLATCSVLPCSWCASWGEHKQRSWEKTHEVSKKKSLKCISTSLWEFHMETKHNRESISQIIIFVKSVPFSLKISLQQSSTVIPYHWLKFLAGYSHGSACSWPFWMLPSCKKGVPGPPYLCFAITRSQL